MTSSRPRAAANASKACSSCWNTAPTPATGLADQPELRGELQRVVGRLLNDLEIGEAAVRVRQQRVELLEAHSAPARDRLSALRELGASQRAANQIGAARTTLGAARALCGASGLGELLDCVAMGVDAGRLDFIESRWDDTQALVAPALAALERMAPGSEDLASAHELMASLHAARNRADEALAHYRQALSLRQTLWGEGSGAGWPRCVSVSAARCGRCAGQPLPRQSCRRPGTPPARLWGRSMC